MRVKSSLLAIAAATALSLPAVADAQLVSLSPFLGLTGGGLGSQNTVLTLQAGGNQGVATTGCVGLGAGQAAFANCNFANNSVQTGQSQLLTQSAFPGLTAGDFRIVFNGQQPPSAGTPLTLNNLVVTFYGSNNTFEQFLLGSATNIPMVGNGTGNFGYVFGLTPGSADYDRLQSFLNSNQTYSIGIGASVSGTSAGLQTFAVVNANQLVTNTVPEPSTYVLMASGLLALGVVARRRRRA